MCRRRPPDVRPISDSLFGGKRCFKNKELLILAQAINPVKFLNFLEDPIGKALATRHLKKQWNSILDRTNKIRKKNEILTDHAHKMKKSIV